MHILSHICQQYGNSESTLCVYVMMPNNRRTSVKAYVNSQSNMRRKHGICILAYSIFRSTMHHQYANTHSTIYQEHVNHLSHICHTSTTVKLLPNICQQIHETCVTRISNQSAICQASVSYLSFTWQQYLNSLVKTCQTPNKHMSTTCQQFWQPSVEQYDKSMSNACQQAINNTSEIDQQSVRHRSTTCQPVGSGPNEDALFTLALGYNKSAGFKCLPHPFRPPYFDFVTSNLEADYQNLCNILHDIC